MGLLALTPRIAELVHSHLAEDFCGHKMDVSIFSQKMAINVLWGFQIHEKPFHALQRQLKDVISIVSCHHRPLKGQFGSKNGQDVLPLLGQLSNVLYT